jgi:hypothetical protein
VRDCSKRNMNNTNRLVTIGEIHCDIFEYIMSIHGPQCRSSQQLNQSRTTAAEASRVGFAVALVSPVTYNRPIEPLFVTECERPLARFRFSPVHQRRPSPISAGGILT